ncbi:glycosyltransferase family 2 protein [Raoultella sp. C349492]|uniref:glycosyltransferase family 2 protein n=1 Tax=Raoultella sp. C349492 TaxID=2970253 RepID=UPI0035C6CE51
MINVICVILYGKGFQESLTLRNLGEMNFSDYHLVIINNGPIPIKKDNLFFRLKENFTDVSCHEYLDNKSLAVVYNTVINKFKGSDRFVFFDDDTDVSSSYFEDMLSHYDESIDLQLPQIVEVDKDIKHYPFLNNRLFTGGIPTVFINKDTILSIGSGLVVYKKMINCFNENNMTLFDERYALYGVDYSFFRRIDSLKRLNYNFNIQVFTSLKHSLSKTESGFSEWRHREHLHDYAISCRFYSKSLLHMLLGMLRCIFRELIKKRFSNIKLVLCTFVKGKHPRCN